MGRSFSFIAIEMVVVDDWIKKAIDEFQNRRIYRSLIIDPGLHSGSTGSI
jgi:hypothetical protein